VKSKELFPPKELLKDASGPKLDDAEMTSNDLVEGT
jgi:hypothetical protein